MTNKLNEKVADFDYENLFNSDTPPSDVFSVSIKGAQGVIQRGTVLSLVTGDVMTVLKGVEGATANCILAEEIDTTDVSATATINGLAYRTGHFNRNCLFVGEGYTLSAADEESLRNGGILLSDALNY